MIHAIAGVSGNTGRVAAETLLNAGEKVRVIVRDAAKGEAWKARGAEVAVADVTNAASLAAALKGADTAYLLLPPRVAPGFREYQLETGRALVAAVEQAQPKHVVFLSSVGAQHAAGAGPISGLYPVEQGLRAVNAKHAAVNVTFLRAGYFMENLGGSLGALAHGILPGFLPVDLPIDMIATVDIGRTAASLLREGGQGVQVVQLGGPGVTGNDAAAALTRLVGKPIQAVSAPTDQVVPTLTGFGMPADLAAMYQEMIEGIGTGHVSWEAGQRRIQGTTTVDTVLAGLLAGAQN